MSFNFSLLFVHRRQTKFRIDDKSEISCTASHALTVMKTAGTDIDEGDNEDAYDNFWSIIDCTVSHKGECLCAEFGGKGCVFLQARMLVSSYAIDVLCNLFIYVRFV